MTRPFTPEEVRELYAKAQGLYATIIGLTESPREAQEIICMIHLLLYLNHGDGNGNVDGMLASYCKVFKLNYEGQVEAGKGQFN